MPILTFDPIETFAPISVKSPTVESLPITTPEEMTAFSAIFGIPPSAERLILSSLKNEKFLRKQGRDFLL